MTLNKKCLFLAQFFLFTGIVFFVFGCAVPQKPQGGPKDVNAPKLLKATPANQTHNFSSRVIELDFDEYFKLANPFQEISISPTQEKQPDYNYTKKAKSLIITLKDTLHKNTTYVINFGKAIVDLNEGNVLKNFTYVFSTGTHIDSLSISGRVINTLTQDREKDVTVMLFSLLEDSLRFRKKKPTIYTTTDTAGNFTLGNLHEGIYKLYALKETAADKIYNNENELIGIPNKIINLQVDTSNVQLSLFKEVPMKFNYSVKRFDADGKIFLAFNRPLDKPGLRIIYPAALNADKYVEINKTRDTAMLYIKNMDFDSVRIARFDNNKPIDSVSFRKGRKETYTRTVSIGTNADGRGLLKPGTDLLLTASTPITSYDQSLIELKGDSTIITDYTLKQDTANLKRFTLSYKWRQNVGYTLTFNENALTGYWGEKNKKLIPRRFKVDKPDNYSKLTLLVTVPDTSKAYLVEFLSEQGSLIQSTTLRDNRPIVFRSLLAGKYRVRVIYDDNKNGKWDSGDIKTNRQPENVWVDRQVIPVRANLDTDVPIDIPREPTP